MNKKYRQYVGIAVAVLAYYVIHEGAHLVVALMQGVFKQINIIGMGVQIDVFADRMTPSQMALFCLAGPLATIIVGWIMVMMVRPICQVESATIRACAWYVSLTMLMLDPIYLSLFYRWVGGGDMNGISLLLSQSSVSVIAAVIGVINFLLIWKVLYPIYTKSFAADK